jgi:ABC-type transport system involved in cytochrome bd biosynthesis fused ATPase/permease subunit
VSKAAVAVLVGRVDALSTERRYVRHVLPSAVARDLATAARRDLGGATRAVAVVAGLTLTSAGFGIERVRAMFRSLRRATTGSGPR